MRNMKRALSLVLALVMLMGMVMIPTGAAGNFTDADLIENTEAVAITSGIGLFAGTTNGEFAPKATVTRAQMATIIVKMLRGSDFNADAFKGVGVNPFPDTAAFEGGWAEGYINACYQMGVVAGYGDGTFQPGKPLTTAEALTMIINALGVDPGPGEWPVTYMAKAEEMKLYGDMAAKPATDSFLNRDQLAAIVWEGMQYSPKGENGWRIDGYDVLFESYADALKAAGNDAGKVNEAVGEDSLASKVYEIKTTSSWITGNAATGEKCTVLSDKNGIVGSFDVETGVDMLGHYVTVYYKEAYVSDKQPGEVYTIVDESTVVTVTEVIDSAKDYKAAFGSRCDMAGDGAGVMLFDGTYNWDAVDSNDKPDFGAIPGYTAGSAANPGTYIIADGMVVAYIQPVAVTASYIAGFGYVEGEEQVYIGLNSYSNAQDNDRLVEYEGMAKGDFVTYVVVNGTCVLSPVEAVTGVISKTSKVKVDGVEHNAITLNGQVYPSFEPKSIEPGKADSRNETKLDNNLPGLQYGQTYTLYVTENGRYVGFEAGGSTISIDNTAYLLGTLPAPIKEKDKYGTVTFVNKARGVDLEGKEVLIIIGKAKDVNGNGEYDSSDAAEALGSMGAVSQGFYTVKDSLDSDEKKEGIQVLEAYATSYTPETPTYVTKTYEDNSGFTGNRIATMEGVSTIGSSNTKYLFIAGDVDQDEPLTVQMTTGAPSSAIKITKADPDEILVTRTGADSDLEVFVRVTEEEVLNTIYVYVTPEQFAARGQVPEGISYMAYSCITGAETEIIIGDGETDITGPGFVRLKEVDEDVYDAEYSGINLRKEYTQSGTPDISVVVANVGLFGETSGRIRFHRMVGVETDAIVINDGGTTVTTNTAGPGVNGLANYYNSKATSATVVDMRDDRDIASSGVPTIANMTQLLSLLEADPGLMVVFDFAMYGHYLGHEGKGVFIKKVVRDTIGLNAIIYAEGFGSDAGGAFATGYVARSANADTGDYEKVYADRIKNAGPGFYFYGVDADGNIALVPFDANVAYQGNYGMVAMHESVTRMDATAAGTLRMVTADNVDHRCSASCKNAQFEALKDVTVTADTLIYDQVEGDFLTLDELENMYSSNQLNVDFFCSTGVYDTSTSAQNSKDNTVELLVITGKEEISVSCDDDHTGYTPFSGTISTSGKYYLTDDVTSQIVVPEGVTVTLCLNGKNILAASAFAIEVKSGAHLTLLNGRGGGKVGPASGNTNRSIMVRSGATVDMYDGITLTRESTESNGGGVNVQAGGTFNMWGGSISTCKNAAGGSVYVTGTFNMKGGTISGNEATSTSTGGGAMYVDANGEVNMSGGTITGNTAYCGGGVYVLADGKFTMSGDAMITANKFTTTSGAGAGGVFNAGTFIMDGGTISSNGGQAQGGGVYNKKTFTMNGGTITENTVTNTNGKGGGVYNQYGGTFTMTGGTISKNVAKSAQGGGVANYATMTMSGGTIEGNTSGTYGGGVANCDGSFVMSNGVIKENSSDSSSSGGGGVYTGKPFEMTGGTISGNKATKAYGGGVYVTKNGTFTKTGGTLTGNTAVLGGDDEYKAS